MSFTAFKMYCLMEQQLLFYLLVSALVLLSTEIHHVACDTYHILTSSSSSQCPGEFTGEPCLTLQQFANNPGRSSSVLLMMESGSHTLDSPFSLSNIYNFTVIPKTPNDTVKIACNTQSGGSAKFLLTSISFIQLQGVSVDSCIYSKFGTNGDSVLMSNMTFTNWLGVSGGMEIRNISNSVQLNNVSFINSGTTRIEMAPTTQILMRDILFKAGRSITVAYAAEVLVENSIFEGGTNSALLLSRIARGTVSRCRFNNNDGSVLHDGSSNSGGMSVYHSASVLISESTFNSNGARGSGAIYGYNSSVTISGNTFTANYKSAVYVEKVNLTVINSSFSDNRGVHGAAVHALRSLNLRIIGCTFTNNVGVTEYSNGGALVTFTCATVSIHNSSFVNNRAAYGGAISAQSGNTYLITDSTFTSNTASGVDADNGGSLGGAVRFLWVSQLRLLHSRFDSNLGGARGGAIFVESGSVTTKWSNFTNNSADGGGGLYVLDADNTEVSVSHSYFKNNTARAGSGGAIYYGGEHTNVSLIDSTFDYNSASICAVLDIDDFHHYSVKLIGSTFSYNTATGRLIGGGQGGVVCVKNASISVIDSTFSHNSAVLHAGVFNVDDSVLNVERSLFVNNSAGTDGGIMYTIVNPTTYTVRLSTFVNNTAGRSGGVVFVGRANSQVTIERSSCGYNSAENRGGVVAIAGSNLVIDETNIINNTARLGGAISACSSNVTVSSELAGTEDPTSSLCTLYDGYIDNFNISDFIRQELSTTTSMPVAMTTTSMTTPATIGTTTQREPTTTDIILTSHGTSFTGPQGSSPTTSTEDTQSTTSKFIDKKSHTSTNYVVIAIACVSVFLTVSLCVLILVFMTVKITSKLTRSGRLGYSQTNQNEFIMQEENYKA